MRVSLDDEDRRAVDLLLERANEIGDIPPVEQLFHAPVAVGFERRLDAAEAFLGLLDNMPAEDPPDDLVSRTLERVRAADSHEQAELAQARPVVPSQRPHA